MPPFAAALIDFGHLLGALLLAGGLLHLGFVALPAGNQLEQEDRERFASAMRWRGRIAMLVGMALLIGTGLTKWAPGTGVGWIGHGGIRTAFPDYHERIDELIDAGDRIVVRLTITGTHLGPMPGLEPTGRRVEFRDVSVCEVRAGRIVRQAGLTDYLTLYAQLGLVTPPG